MGLIMYNGVAYGSAVEGEYGWVDLTSTLTAGSTTLTIQNEVIDPTKCIEIFTDVYGVTPSNAVVTSGQIVLTFEAQESNLGVKVRVTESKSNRHGGLNATEHQIISTTYTVNS